MADSLRARAPVPFVVTAVLVALAACTASTDLGKPDCHLLKKSADGGVENVVVNDLSAGKDFLSFGSVECEDLVCVLDQAGVSQVLARATAQVATNPGVLDEPALGYCSRACAQGSTSTCSPQFEDQQEDPTLVMSCRQLVLDQDTIAEICKDPVKCREYFDNNRSPFFCARGDAGT